MKELQFVRQEVYTSTIGLEITKENYDEVEKKMEYMLMDTMTQLKEADSYLVASDPTERTIAFKHNNAIVIRRLLCINCTITLRYTSPNNYTTLKDGILLYTKAKEIYEKYNVGTYIHEHVSAKTAYYSSEVTDNDTKIESEQAESEFSGVKLYTEVRDNE